MASNNSLYKTQEQHKTILATSIPTTAISEMKIALHIAFFIQYKVCSLINAGIYGTEG